MRKLLLIVSVLALAGCSMGSQTQIERNRQKWQDANISHYRFDLFVGCFCVFSQDMPLAIEVRDGELISMEYQSGNEIDPINRELFDKYTTIDRIFTELETNLDGKADEVTVKYDPAYGFPAQINVDFIKEAIDDELALSVSNFEELP